MISLIQAVVINRPFDLKVAHSGSQPCRAVLLPDHHELQQRTPGRREFCRLKADVQVWST